MRISIKEVETVTKEKGLRRVGSYKLDHSVTDTYEFSKTSARYVSYSYNTSYEHYVFRFLYTSCPATVARASKE